MVDITTGKDVRRICPTHISTAEEKKKNFDFEIFNLHFFCYNHNKLN